MEYKDFDCLIDPHQAGYKIRILDSPVGVLAVPVYRAAKTQ